MTRHYLTLPYLTFLLTYLLTYLHTYIHSHSTTDCNRQTHIHICIICTCMILYIKLSFQIFCRFVCIYMEPTVLEKNWRTQPRVPQNTRWLKWEIRHFFHGFQVEYWWILDLAMPLRRPSVNGVLEGRDVEVRSHLPSRKTHCSDIIIITGADRYIYIPVVRCFSIAIFPKLPATSICHGH